jgi:tetratricopeptide (TPR) repeat protein
VVLGDRDELELGNVSVDVWDCRRLASVADWKGVDQLFEGPFFAGVHLDSLPFSNWLENERAVLNDLASRAAEGLLLDGLLERAYGLRDRLAISEASEIVNAIADLDERNVFVGRLAEMSVLEGYAEESSTGFVAAMVEGEPGIGKSSLLDRFGRLRALRGSTVFLARSFLAERQVPFGAVSQWISFLDPSIKESIGPPWRAILEHAFPEVANEGRIDDWDGSPEVDLGAEHRIYEALARTFQACAARHPLVLVLDDAQWADLTSIGFIHYLSRRSRQSPILFVGAIRSPAAKSVSELLDWPDTRRLQIPPFGASEIEAYLERHRVRDQLGPDTIHVSRRTGGNPLILSLLVREDRLGPDAPIPETVADWLLPRLQAFDRAAVRILAGTSILGDAATPDSLGSAFDYSTSIVDHAVDELRLAGLVVIGQDQVVRPRHGVVAEIALATLPATERRSLHGRSARTLAGQGRTPHAVTAIHHDIAGDQQRAYEAALHAAAASQALYAVREWEYFLKLALANAPSIEHEVDIRVRLARLYRRIGREEEGLRLVRDDSIARAPPASKARARASELAIQLGTMDPGCDPSGAWDDINALEPQLPAETVAELYSLLSATSHYLGRPDDTVRAAKRALDFARLLSRQRSSIVTSRSALILGLYMGIEEGLHQFEMLRPHISDDLETLCHCLPSEGTLLQCSGELRRAEEVYLTAIEIAERVGYRGNSHAVRNNLGACYIDQGRYEEAQQVLNEAAMVVEQTLGSLDSAIVRDNLSIMHYERGAYGEAVRVAESGPWSEVSRSTRAQFSRYSIIGLCSLELGLLARAFEVKREIELLLTRHEYWSNDVSYVETFLARMLALEGKPEEARRRLEAAIDVYRTRDMMCRARMELELARLELKSDPEAALARATTMLGLLQGSGARPLIDRFEELADRAGRRVTS